MIVFLCWLFSSMSLAQPYKFYGEVAQEIKLKFEAQIEVRLEGNLTLSKLKQGGTQEEIVRDRIDVQIEHLIGYFQSTNFDRLYKSSASIDVHYRIVYTSVTRVSKTLFSIGYTFEGKGVVDKKLFQTAAKRSLELRVPKNPNRIYALGVVNGVNLCTDKDYNSRDDFFYFWDLDLPGCPLKGNHPAVLTIKAEAEVLPNTDRTYPEYDKLFTGEKNIFLFVGYLDDEIIPGRVNRRDRGHSNYQDLILWLQKNGFKVIKELNNVRGDIIADRQVVKGGNRYHHLQLTVETALGTEVVWNVHALLSDTSYGSRDETFHMMYARALETGSLIAYDGHSGLGANLDLSVLPKFDFKKMDYQIIYLNGCSSYPYFKSPYFKAKGGSKKLDLITSGLPTLDSTSLGNIVAFLNPFIKGKILSYQKILKDIELSNGSEGTYLTAVNGDEDNEWTENQ